MSVRTAVDRHALRSARRKLERLEIEIDLLPRGSVSRGNMIHIAIGLHLALRDAVGDEEWHAAEASEKPSSLPRAHR